MKYRLFTILVIPFILYGCGGGGGGSDNTPFATEQVTTTAATATQVANVQGQQVVQSSSTGGASGASGTSNPGGNTGGPSGTTGPTTVTTPEPQTYTPAECASLGIQCDCIRKSTDNVTRCTARPLPSVLTEKTGHGGYGVWNKVKLEHPRIHSRIQNSNLVSSRCPTRLSDTVEDGLVERSGFHQDGPASRFDGYERRVFSECPSAENCSEDRVVIYNDKSSEDDTSYMQFGYWIEQRLYDPRDQVFLITKGSPGMGFDLNSVPVTGNYSYSGQAAGLYSTTFNRTGEFIADANVILHTGSPNGYHVAQVSGEITNFRHPDDTKITYQNPHEVNQPHKAVNWALTFGRASVDPGDGEFLGAGIEGSVWGSDFHAEHGALPAYITGRFQGDFGSNQAVFGSFSTTPAE